jgi:hypothetical protein
MKTVSRRFASFASLLVLLLAVAGCNTVSINSNQYVGVTQYPPTDPASIQIMRAEPTRPNIRLGEVRAVPSSESVTVQKIEESLRTAAAKMGADAVVIIQDSTQITGAVVTGPWYGRSVQTIQGRVVVGVAIKYQ